MKLIRLLSPLALLLKSRLVASICFHESQSAVQERDHGCSGISQYLNVESQTTCKLVVAMDVPPKDLNVDVDFENLTVEITGTRYEYPEVDDTTKAMTGCYQQKWSIARTEEDSSRDDPETRKEMDIHGMYMEFQEGILILSIPMHTAEEHSSETTPERVGSLLPKSGEDAQRDAKSTALAQQRRPRIRGSTHKAGGINDTLSKLPASSFVDKSIKNSLLPRRADLDDESSDKPHLAFTARISPPSLEEDEYWFNMM